MGSGACVLILANDPVDLIAALYDWSARLPLRQGAHGLEPEAYSLAIGEALPDHTGGPMLVATLTPSEIERG